MASAITQNIAAASAPFVTPLPLPRVIEAAQQAGPQVSETRSAAATDATVAKSDDQRTIQRDSKRTEGSFSPSSGDEQSSGDTPSPNGDTGGQLDKFV